MVKMGWKRPDGWGWPRWRGWRVVMDNMMIHKGEMLPRWYGVAWREADRDCVIVMPVPINLCAGLLRRVWHWLRYASMSTSALDSLVKRVFDRGYDEGKHVAAKREEWIRHQAYEAGRRDTMAALDGFRDELRELRADIDAP